MCTRSSTSFIMRYWVSQNSSLRQSHVFVYKEEQQAKLMEEGESLQQRNLSEVIMCGSERLR